jgi:hypothetical protein
MLVSVEKHFGIKLFLNCYQLFYNILNERISNKQSLVLTSPLDPHFTEWVVESKSSPPISQGGNDAI